MYLKHGTLNGKKFLSIAHNYRDPKTKKVRAKIVKTLGYFDELEKQYLDPVAHFKQVIAEMNAKVEGEKASLRITISPSVHLEGATRKNLGYAALSKVYHELGLDVFFANNSRKWGVEYNVNSIMKTEIFSRILFPGSKKKTYENREVFFENTDYELIDVYRCLGHINPLSNAIQQHLHLKVKKNYGRKTDLVYYDVTNYYFEIDEQRPEDTGGDSRFRGAKIMKDDLRRKGVSKEHRPDPIVQMGLFMDTEGVPISYRLFPGNTNDCETMFPYLTQIKRDFADIGRIIVVADKGLNTSPNLVGNTLNGDGYVFSQKVRGSNAELQKYVLDENGYVWISEDYKIKSRLHPRIVYVKDIHGKEKQVRLDEKQVIFYSKAYDKKAKADREAAIVKARDLVANPSKYKKATSYGAAKYVKNIEYDPKTGEILTSKSTPVFDEKKLKEEEKWDGYYAIVTSELKKTDNEIIEIYRGLWKIEESFKVTKSDFETRPVYLSRKDHIEAHFLICFIALVIIRILEKLLEYKFSASRLAESLSRASCCPLEENWFIFDYADEVTAEIKNTLGIDLTHKYLRLGEIKNILAHTKK